MTISHPSAIIALHWYVLANCWPTLANLWTCPPASCAWDWAAMQVTPGENFTFPVYAWSLWEWALDLLLNPLLVPHFIWDAQRLFKYNGSNYERFYLELWTGDHWWDIQSHLPDVENAVPFAVILYAN
ncbi:hypothetical protein F5141DRAFT_1068372 [Pisolithus sp. B1]|nr:hypothetical protein F5141DRAFT_1068372 [Pisolithus sp. B1]